MKEYIEREKGITGIDDLPRWGMFGDLIDINDTLDVLNREPAADVVERVRGEWIGTQYDGYADGCPVYDEYECSVCGAEYPTDHNFCPNCGADMRGQ